MVTHRNIQDFKLKKLELEPHTRRRYMLCNGSGIFNTVCIENFILRFGFRKFFYWYRYRTSVFKKIQNTFLPVFTSPGTCTVLILHEDTFEKLSPPWHTQAVVRSWSTYCSNLAQTYQTGFASSSGSNKKYRLRLALALPDWNAYFCVFFSSYRYCYWYQNLQNTGIF